MIVFFIILILLELAYLIFHFKKHKKGWDKLYILTSTIGTGIVAIARNPVADWIGIIVVIGGILLGQMLEKRLEDNLSSK